MYSDRFAEIMWLSMTMLSPDNGLCLGKVLAYKTPCIQVRGVPGKISREEK
jgi:hypothetical protein